MCMHMTLYTDSSELLVLHREYIVKSCTRRRIQDPPNNANLPHWQLVTVELSVTVSGVPHTTCNAATGCLAHSKALCRSVSGTTGNLMRQRR
jgi:hypothetical protein